MALGMYRITTDLSYTHGVALNNYCGADMGPKLLLKAGTELNQWDLLFMHSSM